MLLSEVGTNNHFTKRAVQRFFIPLKALRNMRNLIFLFSEAQRNIHKERFDSVDAQRNSVVAEPAFRSKSKQLPQLNLQEIMKILHFCDFWRKRSK